MAMLGNIREKLGSDWELFLESLNEEASNQLSSAGTNTDGASVDINYFLQMLQEGYGLRLSEVDQDNLFKTFGAKSENDNIRKLNLKPIMQLKNH